ncbi:GDSL-type esterase/lipase family protein [Aeromonas allosaccharophila]|uniref:GDSL-type esterase/lipase family protein n=1 Tax=Aeromonas allosaccharophila TaxID=656 RepID=UPI003D222FCF
MFELAINFLVFFVGIVAAKIIRRFQFLANVFNRFRPYEIQQTKYWHSKVKLWDELPTKAKVVMFGDSITEGVDWNEILQDNIIVNRGISGDTTSGLLKRIHQVIAISPSIVFIMIGVNDFGCRVNVEIVFENYKKIIEILRGKGIVVVVQSTIYSSEKYKVVNNNIRNLNDKLAEFCQSSNIKYLNLNSVLASNKGLKEIYTYDGIHLSAAGYLVWKDIINVTLVDLSGLDAQE